ncbi:MAG: phospholipid carrier-dependent glycosyltransferase [Nitrospirae bacterium]|nr:MAG: phospholipid carrier-dependent glycosyltransferase [Nitrospirota bacterium]
MKRTQRLYLILGGLFLLGLFLRLYGITSQPPISDEVAASYAAENYLRHGIFGQIMWYHPQLRNILIYIAAHISGGYDAWGLKGASVLTGSLSVVVLGWLAYRLTESITVSGLSALFLAIDPLHIALSREAVQAAMTPFFILLGVFLSVEAIKRDRLIYHYLSGIGFGLATSCKWHGLFPWALMALVVFFDTLRGKGDERPGRLLMLVNAYLLLPLLIYILSYLPWLNRGYDLMEFLRFQFFLVKRQLYHQGPAYAETFMGHHAWTWFVWPTAWVDFVFLNGRPYLNIAMGNLLVWFLTIPSTLYVFFRWRKDRDREKLILLLLFLTSYLPLVLTSRGIWVFSAPSVIPFAFMLTAWSMGMLLQSGRLKRSAVVFYLCLVCLLSAVMYPMSTFRAYEHAYLKPIVEHYNPHNKRWNLER